jgi:hypothetical protein
MAKLEKEPTYNLKLEPVEAFFIMQLIDQCQVKGSEAGKIGNLRDRVQNLLETHETKTGEFVGYQPPNTEIVQEGTQ